MSVLILNSGFMIAPIALVHPHSCFHLVYLMIPLLGTLWACTDMIDISLMRENSDYLCEWAKAFKKKGHPLLCLSPPAYCEPVVAPCSYHFGNVCRDTWMFWKHISGSPTLVDDLEKERPIRFFVVLLWHQGGAGKAAVTLTMMQMWKRHFQSAVPVMTSKPQQ